MLPGNHRFSHEIWGFPAKFPTNPLNPCPEGPGTTATRGKYSESSAGDGCRILAPKDGKNYEKINHLGFVTIFGGFFVYLAVH
jgi:hypothetical protein